jgi:anthranilate 1,2-dioxygenase small subunit
VTAIPIDNGHPRQVVEELLAAYVTAIDDGDLERWPEFFTADCSYRIVPRENDALNLPLAVMSCDSRAALTDRIAAYRKANLFAPHAYRHMLGPVRVRDEGNREMGARTNYAVFRTSLDPIDYGISEVFSVGEYRDRIVIVGGVARFREKTVVVDTCKIHTLLATPL